MLTALDYHYGKLKGKAQEVEYRLISWGEIYPPFLGNREHSFGARFILREFPFKLFSVSTPYSELPQKLCLTFHAPLERDETQPTSSMEFSPDDIAKEFASFLSILTRRRVFATHQSRVDGFPVEAYASFYQSQHSQERQRLKEIQPDEINRLLVNLQTMNRDLARSLVLAMRLYHSAVEMMFTEPEFSYLFLVMSVEAISSVAHKKWNPFDEAEGDADLEHYLDSNNPGWRDLCDISTSERREKVVDMLLSKAYFTKRKFQKFIATSVPEAYWNEPEDDAKPDYLVSMVKAGPDYTGREEISRRSMELQDWEKIDRSSLEKTLAVVYDTRNKFVHEGKPFPREIVTRHFRRIPIDAFEGMIKGVESAGSASHAKPIIPPLIAFERLVSYCMVEFLRRQTVTIKDRC